MGSLILNIMSKFGYFGVFLLITLENVFPPIPSEVILTFGGFLVAISELKIIGVIIASTLGSLLGAIILYYLGSLINVKKEDLGKTSKWFLKYGHKAVLFGRFIPIIRSLISIPAGINKMNMAKFIIYTTIGSLIWNSALVSAGFFLGENWPMIAKILGRYSKIVLIILALILFVKIIKAWKMKNK